MSTKKIYSYQQYQGNSSDEEGITTRTGGRGRNGGGENGVSREELDSTSLAPEAAAKKFKNAEKRRGTSFI